MSPYHFTLKNLVSQMGHTLGAHTAWSAAGKRTASYMDGADDATKRAALRVIKDILSAHPEFKREAAQWIKHGIQMTK